MNEIKLNITKSVRIIEDSFKNAILYKISYNNYIYNYEGTKPQKRKKFTWNCENYRKTKNLPENKKIL